MSSLRRSAWNASRLHAPDGHALALWLGGHAKDQCEGVAGRRASASPLPLGRGYDPINGVRQDLVIAPHGGGTEIKGLLVSDAPLIIRLSDK